MTTIVFGVSGRTKALVISHGQVLLGVLGVIKPFELSDMQKGGAIKIASLLYLQVVNLFS